MNEGASGSPTAGLASGSSRGRRMRCETSVSTDGTAAATDQAGGYQSDDAESRWLRHRTAESRSGRARRAVGGRRQRLVKVRGQEREVGQVDGPVVIKV